MTTETINQNLHPPHTHEGNKKTINPSGQDENQILTDKQSKLGTPFNPTGLSPTQWERQKSIFSHVLDGYTSPGGGQVNIQNLMMLVFTQSRQEGEMATLAGLYSPSGDYIVPSLKNVLQCNTMFGGV